MSTGYRPHQFINVLALFVLAVVSWVFASYVDARAINAPFHDDILDVLNFTLRYVDVSGVGEFLTLLHEQHNDHRTAASRLAYISSFELYGEINFRLLMLLANLALVVLLASFFVQVRKDSRSIVFLLIVALLLLHPRNFALLTFPMAAFAFFYLYAYTFVALACLNSESRWGLALAIVAAFAANFSIASGQLTWVFGLLMLLWQQQLHGGKKLSILIWLLFSVLSLVLFHWGLETPNTFSVMIQKFLETPLRHLHFFLLMMGSVTAYESVLSGTALGTVYLLLLALITLRDWKGGLTTIHWFAWFIVASIAVTTLGRVFTVTLDYALSPRYSFASMNLVVCLFILVLRQKEAQNGRALLAAVLMAATINVTNYRTYTPVYDAYMERRVLRFNRDHHWIYGYPIDQTKAIVKRAVERGIYRPPEKPLVLRK